MMISKKYSPTGNVPLKNFAPMIISLLIGLTGCIIIFMMVRSRETQRLTGTFESRARLIADSMQNRLKEYEGTLQFLRDYLYNSKNVSRQDFSSFVKGAIYRYPAIQALCWNPRVRESDRNAFEEHVRNEGFQGFYVTERNSDGEIIYARGRENYFPVCYIDPLPGNSAALGFDISSESVRRQSMIRARKTGNLTASHRLILVQDQENQHGLLLLLPVFNQEIPVSKSGDPDENLRGYVVEILRINDIVESVMPVFPDDGIDFVLYDLSAPEENQFLYRYTAGERKKSQDGRELPSPSAQQSLACSLDIGGSHWELRFFPSPEALGELNRHQSWITLLVSLFIIFMMAYYRTKKIIDTFKVEEAVHAARKSNALLEAEVIIRKQEEIKLLSAKQRLENEVRERIHAQRQRDGVIEELTRTLAEVKTLRGILPLCSFCKKIRDDKGYWEQVDVYIHKYSQADISHSICPECMKKHYPQEYREIFENPHESCPK